MHAGCNERSSGGISSIARANRDDTGGSIDLDRVRRGDEQELRRLIEEFSSLVYHVALGITRSEADAEDILQEVFIGLPEALEGFDGENLAGWLKTIAGRRALLWQRRERRRRKAENMLPRPTSVEDETLSRIMLEAALPKLDPALRTVFILRAYEGLSHAEIADALGGSVGLSRVRYLRARKALRKLMSP